MKKTILITLVCLMGVALAASSAFAQTEIVTFTNPLSGGDLTITGSGSGVGGSIDFSGGILLDGSTHGDTAGLTGTITGTYSWTNAGITPEGGGTQAPLSGSGTISISDGDGHNLTGTVVSMEKIETNAAGDFMPVNDLLVLNLSGLSYSGTNADLLALATLDAGKAELDFTGNLVTTGNTLYSLQIGTETIAYTGDIKIVPLPGSVLLLGTGLLGLALLGFRRKRSLFEA